MYNEVQRPKQQSVTRSVIFLVCIVVLMVLIQCLTSLINRSLRIHALDYVVYVFLVIGAVWFFIRRMISYSYSIIDSDIIIEKSIGNRQRCVECINSGEIVDMGTHIPSGYEIVKNRRFSIAGSKKNAYYIVYKRNGKIYSVTLHPTQKFITHMEHKIRTRIQNATVKEEPAGE